MKPEQPAKEQASVLFQVWKFVCRPPWRTVFSGVAFLLLVLLARAVWHPGWNIRDGRHDLWHNGIWMQHGWLGADSWFIENEKTARIPHFRSKEEIRKVAALLKQNHITDVYPHLCPAQLKGEIAEVNDAQVEHFLDGFYGFRVMPWVGGVLDDSARPDDVKWRKVFIASCAKLLKTHPRLSGVHINIEPMPSGNADYLKLLDEMRAALPKGKLLSVAAYPPPTYWHPFPEVHWEEAYFRQVAQRCDQMVVMMYDAAIKDPKIYQHVMRGWTRDVLTWSGKTEVLLGVPAYDDAGVGYHDPRIENIENALLGIHAGLGGFRQLPSNYKGVALYSEWQMTEEKWQNYRDGFLKTQAP